MAEYIFKLPDLGEGTVEAEISEWHVKPGDSVNEDDVLVDVMTDKASVEIPSPVTGTIVSVSGEAGDTVPVGTDFIIFDTADEIAPLAATTEDQAGDSAGESTRSAPDDAVIAEADQAPTTPTTEKIITSPAIRRRAREAGVDLSLITGTGPRGRIRREDLDAYLGGAVESAVPQKARGGTEEIKVIGLRRMIARRMSDSKRNIPHFSYVEEIDVTELESLRTHLNTSGTQGAGLTYLPFVMMALARALESFPQCNAHYDESREVIVRHAGVHVGVATQTKDGLKVPVVRHVESLTLAQLANETQRVTGAARDGTATRDELGGSTITVTSLGKLGGIVTTPVINAPEVTIVGINRAVERPVVHAGKVTVRRMMNLSTSCDHRFVDGYDAAAMIQVVKDMLEHPATIFT
jgi:2-oxoisovalerate dehydrogenase E2 component (dihydrolipoyl transacylase)